MSGGSATDHRLEVVTVSSALEDTPEGMARMDRLRQSEEERRRQMPAEFEALNAAVEAEVERRMLGLPPSGEAA